MKYVLAIVICVLFVSQVSAQQIALTCMTMLVEDKPSNQPVFTAELDTLNRTIIWTGPGTFGKRKTDLVIEETQYTWSFDCDNSKSLCFKDNGRINRLTGQFGYMHVFPGDGIKWTDYEGECKAGIKKLF